MTRLLNNVTNELLRNLVKMDSKWDLVCALFWSQPGCVDGHNILHVDPTLSPSVHVLPPTSWPYAFPPPFNNGGGNSPHRIFKFIISEYSLYYIGRLNSEKKVFISSLNSHFWGAITIIIAEANSWIFRIHLINDIQFLYENSHYQNSHFQKNRENHK